MRAAGFTLLLALLVLALPSQAHNKSLSFSEWQWSGRYLSVSFTTPARDVTLLPEVQLEADLSTSLAAHVSEFLKLEQINTPCRLERPFEKAAARTGYIRVTGRFACFSDSAPLTIHNHAFFNLARSHVHFARIALAGGKLADSNEILFTATQRSLQVQPTATGQVESTAKRLDVFQNYLWLGISHILTGYDHLAFVLCLLLIARTQRRAILLVSGFTIGHSLTLALATLGLVTPNGQIVEALIGGSIALVAAETVLAKRGKMPMVGASAAGILFILSGLGVVFFKDIPLSVWSGLILFCLCYGLAIRDESSAHRLAPFMTVAFGLVHGFGFAGLLSDIGLPAERLVSGLFGFNLGVELGQLLVLVPALIFGPYIIDELPKLKLRWSDMSATALTALGVYLFVSRLLVA